jgi:hypothetical protein
MLTATGGNKKVGLRPLHGATRFRAKAKYIPGVRQLQGTALCCSTEASFRFHRATRLRINLPGTTTIHRVVNPRNFLGLAAFPFCQETLS